MTRFPALAALAVLPVASAVLAVTLAAPAALAGYMGSEAPAVPGAAPAAAATATVGGAADGLVEALSAAAPGLDPAVLSRALDSTRCARQAGALSEDLPRVLTIIDFSMPSTAERLWVLDLERPAVLLQTHVAHGQGTGDDLAQHFSNTDGSHQSSLGLYKTAERYRGKHGLSLRLDGLDEGLNDRARARAIVVHGADYATTDFIEQHGRLGRSWGCPAVAPQHIESLIETIEGGAPLFAWHPDEEGLEDSKWRTCELAD